MNCPSCHDQVEVLERNYGALFTCPKCQAVYFVNFEGQPEYSQETPQDSQWHGDNTPLAENNNDMSPMLDTMDAELPPSAFSGIAQEISDFGNSEVQITALNYTLVIEGLDTKEDVKAFKETISDNRFGWDVTKIMQQIKNGKITLEKLNPVQAFVLHKRIHFLNFDLKWKQNVLE